MKLISAFCSICIFLCVTPLTEANDSRDAAKWMTRADSLSGEAVWFEAAIAYERVYYLSDDPVLRVKANLAKADALKQLGEYSRAADDLQRSLVFPGNDSLRLEVLFQLSLCTYLDGDYSGALSFMGQLRHTTDSATACPGSDLLEGLVLSAQHRWEELREHLENWLGQHPRGRLLKDSLVRYYAENYLAGAPDPLPDPDRARLMSTLLPGSGQVYAGSAGWGVLNAFSQLASLGAFALMAYNGYYFASVIAGLGPFQAFYFGGIRQAGEFAEQNRNSRLESFRAAVDIFLLEVSDQLDS